MQLTAEYLAEQEDCIRGCTKYASSGGSKERYGAVESFVRGHEKILSVGCAGFDPIVTGATHALDVSPLAEKMLRERGWSGVYCLGDCRALPFTDKEFPVGYCSEVVEHLPTFADVVRTFEEMDRVCREWIVSTPIEGLHVRFHRRNLSEEHIGYFCSKHRAEARKFSRWWFVWKGGKAPEFEEVEVDERVPRCVRRFVAGQF